jgi:GT2 family glycosyltransferase/glycosyltransferase involved in cell wall biosynthesis
MVARRLADAFTRRLAGATCDVRFALDFTWLWTRRQLGRLRRLAGKPGTPLSAGQSPPHDTVCATGTPAPDDGVPVASIIIPVYGQSAVTRRCLDAVAAARTRCHYEVIVVDDGSADDTVAVVSAIAGVRLHALGRNSGFVHACNAGASLARGEYLVFLNNDTEVQDDWLDALLKCFDTHPRCGLAGAKLVYPDGRLQEAGGLIFRDGRALNYGRGGDPADLRFGFARQVDYCSGACIALPRTLFESLGGFDTRYCPAYYEDTDLAFAVREAGYEVWYQPRAQVIHLEGVTAGTDPDAGAKRHQQANRKVFVDKWREALLRQPEAGSLRAGVARGMTHRCRARVLVIDAETPDPTRDSGSVRATAMLQILRKLGCHVQCMPVFGDARSGAVRRLQDAGVEIIHAPTPLARLRWWRDNGGDLDVVIACRLPIARECLPLARRYAAQAAVVFDTVDLHFLRLERAAALTCEPGDKAAASRARRAELKLIGHADLTLVVSEYERQLLEHATPGAPVRVLSNIEDVRESAVPFAARRGLLFLGNFGHPPNVDAARWLCREILPRLRERLPGVVLHLVGYGSKTAVGELAGTDVEVHGQVADLGPILDAVRVALAPLRYGAGVKGKINRAMGCGLPVVTTPIGAEGMGLTDHMTALIAADAEDFARATAELYADERLWQVLSVAGLAHVRQCFSLDVATRTLADVLACLRAGLFMDA